MQVQSQASVCSELQDSVQRLQGQVQGLQNHLGLGQYLDWVTTWEDQWHWHIASGIFPLVMLLHTTQCKACGALTP